MSRGRDRDGRVSVLVRNLPHTVRADELRDKFERYGEVRDIYLPKDYHSGRPRGFGFIEFLDPRDAEDAVRDMDGRTFGGREIQVVMSQEKRKTPREMAQREDTSRGRRSRSRSRDRRRDRSRSRDRRRDRSRSRDRRRDRSDSRDRRRDRSRSGDRRRDRSDSRDRRRDDSRDRDDSRGRDTSRDRNASPAAERRSGTPNDRSPPPEKNGRSPMHEEEARDD